jgi:tetratricopeptide (TPR) repeat protein
MELIKKQNLCFSAYKAGKVKVAQKLADEILEELLKFKRIPAISNLIELLKTVGYPINKIKKIELRIDGLKGKGVNSLDHMDWHIEHFKTSKDFLKSYLLNEENWNKSQFGLCYEFILQFGFDAEVFYKLENLKNNESSISSINMDNKTLGGRLKCNYDQIAYELISGQKNTGENEQEKIIKNLQKMNIDHMQTEGHEMATAFRFLGMDEVVLFLCDKLISLCNNVTDIKMRASLTFLRIESLMNLGENNQALKVIENYLNTEPLYQDEKMVFEYLAAEVLYLLGNKKESYKFYKSVHQQNPHYRLVNQRLKLFEAN